MRTNAEVWLEEDTTGRLGIVQVERTDDNEIRLGVQLAEELGLDVATVYLEIEQAKRLMALLGVAVMANELAAHEAAKHGAAAE